MPDCASVVHDVVQNHQRVSSCSLGDVLQQLVARLDEDVGRPILAGRPLSATSLSVAVSSNPSRRARLSVSGRRHRKGWIVPSCFEMRLASTSMRPEWRRRLCWTKEVSVLVFLSK
jgi:hypothetical protein